MIKCADKDPQGNVRQMTTGFAMQYKASRGIAFKRQVIKAAHGVKH